MKIDVIIYNKLQKCGKRLRNEIFKALAVKEAENLARHFRKDNGYYPCLIIKFKN